MDDDTERGCTDCDDINCSGECASDTMLALEWNDMEDDDG